MCFPKGKKKSRKTICLARFFQLLRRARDSNPRYPERYNRFRVCHNRPLCQLSCGCKCKNSFKTTCILSKSFSQSLILVSRSAPLPASSPTLPIASKSRSFGILFGKFRTQFNCFGSFHCTRNIEFLSLRYNSKLK